jgi:predicted NBD/HSP70 family sugar kinase
MLELTERSHKRVFSLIRAQGNISGALLSRQTDMQPSSLVYILRHLNDKKLIRISGLGASTEKGGKRPVLWEVNPEYGNILGIEIMRNALRAVLVNLAGEVLIKVEKEFSPAAPQKNFTRILSTIHEIIAESGDEAKKLLYISLAIPGVVDPFTHRIIFSRELKMENFDMKTPLQSHFNIPVGIVNDANAGALGELWFNRGDQAINNIIHLTYNPQAGGMGLGIVINQKLFMGSNGIAGEFYSQAPSMQQIITTIQTDYPGLESLITSAKSIEEIQIADLIKYATKNCGLSMKVLSHLNHLVAIEIARITGLFDPERVTLGGDLSICSNQCRDEIILSLKELLRNHYPFKIKIPQIHYAKFKIFSTAIGASALYLSEELAL